MDSKDTRQPFRGTYDHKLDAKGRVAVPADWRPEGTLNLVLRTTQREGHDVLRVYTEKHMERMISEIESSTEEGLTPALKRELVGSLNESSVPGSINNQGKLQIPKRTLEILGFDSDVVLVGRGHEFEILTPATHTAITETKNSELSRFKNLFGI